MTKFLTLLTLCCASLTLNNAHANNDFSHFFNSFESLSGNFIQQTSSDTKTALTHSTGYFKFKRPAQFIWQTQKPINQTLLLNKQQLWLIDHELEQASTRSIDELKNTPLYWLLNRPKELESVPIFSYEAQGVRWYNTQNIDKLSFGFANQQLVAIQLINPLGQTILINFTNLVINPIFDEKVFELTLGDDFDVIR